MFSIVVHAAIFYYFWARPPDSSARARAKGAIAFTTFSRVARAHRVESGGTAKARPAAAAAAPAPASEQEGGAETAPEFGQNALPPYPLASRHLREEGLAKILALVNPTGEPAQVTLTSSTGFPRLDEAALQAVRHWKFKPATRAGIPIAARVEIPIRFVLED